jgi:hypothetical protein
MDGHMNVKFGHNLFRIYILPTRLRKIRTLIVRPRGVEVTNECIYTSTTPNPFMANSVTKCFFTFILQWKLLKSLDFPT